MVIKDLSSLCRIPEVTIDNFIIQLYWTRQRVQKVVEV